MKKVLGTKLSGKQFDALAQQEKDYLLLQKVDVEFSGGFSAILNRGEAANLTVCPRCHVDDFVHVEGCEFYVTGA